MQPVSKGVLIELGPTFWNLNTRNQKTRHNIIRVTLTRTFVRGMSRSKCPTIIINVVDSMYVRIIGKLYLYIGICRFIMSQSQLCVTFAKIEFKRKRFHLNIGLCW